MARSSNSYLNILSLPMNAKISSKLDKIYKLIHLFSKQRSCSDLKINENWTRQDSDIKNTFSYAYFKHTGNV
jgi:hypothetical protein